MHFSIGLELGIGESFLLKAVAEACGRTLSSAKESYEKLGDLGLLAESRLFFSHTISLKFLP